MRDLELEGQNVSRETYQKLRDFERMVELWTSKINLVSNSSRNEIWDRHILDSLQIVPLAENPSSWLDIGSGGGFPGLVVAIVLQSQTEDCRVSLVESDKRKAAFLRTVSRELGLNTKIHATRIENLEPKRCTTLSARALAALSDLFTHAERHLQPSGTALFPKGKNWKSEVEEARKKWSFELDVVKSETSGDAAILKISNLTRL